MAKTPPMCATCNERHWNMVVCAAKADRPKPRQFLVETRGHVRMFGDDMSTYTRGRDGTLVLRDRAPLSPLVVKPPEWED